MEEQDEAKELSGEDFLGKLREARKTGSWWIKFTTDHDNYELHIEGHADVYLSPGFKKMSDDELFKFTREMESICRSKK
jgi:hypothetical protein